MKKTKIINTAKFVTEMAKIEEFIDSRDLTALEITVILRQVLSEIAFSNNLAIVGTGGEK